MPTSLPTPTEVPFAIQQRIRDMKCPPPIRPSQQSANLIEMQVAMRKSMDQIDLLEKQVDDLEKRYKITFLVKNQPKYNVDSPNVKISGFVNNVVLDFYMTQPKSGEVGYQGPQGEQGLRGKINKPGMRGPYGYYGNRGNCK
tara:strand:+ start:31 stop:456 length:426 start_codon:yes stop_codon:yes gene_type:complete